MGCFSRKADDGTEVFFSNSGLIGGYRILVYHPYKNVWSFHDSVVPHIDEALLGIFDQLANFAVKNDLNGLVALETHIYPFTNFIESPDGLEVLIEGSMVKLVPNCVKFALHSPRSRGSRWPPIRVRA